MPTPQEIAMQNQANQNLQMQGKGNPMMPPVLNNSVQQIQQQKQQQIANQNRLQQEEQQLRQGRNAGELGGNWNQTFGTPQVGGIQNPNPSWNKPASTPVPGSGSPIGGTGLIATGPSIAPTGVTPPIGGTGVIGGSQSDYNPLPTGVTPVVGATGGTSYDPLFIPPTLTGI